MIVGNGLIASAFIRNDFHSPDHVIFASGVSNSTETNPDCYQREISLIRDYIDKSTTFVYFSTTSIFDPTRQDSYYIKHKKLVEDLIREEAASFLIVRLSIMIGHSTNPHTLINYLVNAIKEQRPVELHANACRHLLDIDDLLPELSSYLEEPKPRKSVNILGSEKIRIPELISKIEAILNKKGNYSWIDAGACFSIPDNEAECKLIADPDYVEKILHKYIHH